MRVREESKSSFKTAVSAGKTASIDRNDLKFRLLLLVFAIALTTFLIKTAIASDIKIPTKAVLAMTFGIGGCVSVSAALYCFSTFILFHQVNHLLAAMAFSALGSGVILQSVADTRRLIPLPHEWLASTGWLVFAIAMAGASFAHESWRPTNKAQSIIRMILSIGLLITFPIAESVCMHNSKELYLLLSPYNALQTYIANITISLLCAVFLLVAQAGYYLRAKKQADEMAALQLYFMVLCSSALAAKILSDVRFDEWWVVSQILILAAWLFLATFFSVQNAFIRKSILERVSEMEVLRQVSWSIIGTGSLQELLDRFTSVLRETLGAKVTALFLVNDDEETTTLVSASSSDDINLPVGKSYKFISSDKRSGFHTGHTAKALTTGEIQVAYDVLVDVELIPWHIIALEDGAAASVPLINGDKVMGVLNVYLSNQRRFTPEFIKLLSTISAAATPAIENAISKNQNEYSCGNWNNKAA